MQLLLKSEHVHTHSKVVRQQNDKLQFKGNIPTKASPPSFLLQQLMATQQKLSKMSIQKIHDLTKHYQKKVYKSIFSDQQNQYLSLVLKGVNVPQQQKQSLQQMMKLKEQNIINKIVSQQLHLKKSQPNQDKIKRIKLELDQKIQKMKYDMNNISYNQAQIFKDKINNSSILLIQDFKKKQYWKDKSFTQQNNKVKSFLSKIKKQKSQYQQKFIKDLQSTKQKLESKQLIQKEQKQKIQQKLHQQIVEKQYKQRSLSRQSYLNQKAQKEQKTLQFLSQFKLSQPIHQRYQKNYKKQLKKQQQQKQKMLKQIKQQHPYYNPQQVQTHMNQYIQRKQKYKEQKLMRDQLDMEIIDKRQNYLKELYHSKYHQHIKDNKKQHQQNIYKLNSNRKKIIQYAKTVKDTCKPQIDNRKQQQVSKNIKILTLMNDPRKKKINKGNGVIQFQDKKQNNSYQKGVSYLQELRDLNSKSRLRQSSTSKGLSLIQLSTSTPKPNPLRQSCLQLNLKPTISDWKNLLSNRSFSSKDKYQRVLDRAESLEIHAGQKAKQLRNMRKKEHGVIQLKEETDRYYMESVAARMVLLKDLVNNN